MQTMLTFSNPTTGKEYQAGNIIRLQDCVDSNPAYVSGQFATFRQWLSFGRVVMKGQKGAARLVACHSDSLAPVKGAPAGTVTMQRGFVKGFTVFAIEQTELLKDATLDTEPEAEPVHEDKPEQGKQYSLATLAKEGTWAKSEVKEAPKRPSIALNTASVREQAERLLRSAELCHATRQINTAKRLAQAMSKRMEGDRDKRAADMMLAAADAVDADPSHEFAKYSATGIRVLAHEASRYKSKHVNNGYHSYLIETSEPEYALYTHDDLRALIDPRTRDAEAIKAAQIQAEATLRQCDIPGFFPTPKSVIATMLEQAGDLKGKSILEPSAGKGDIVQAAFNAGAETVKAFELVPQLASYLCKFVKVPRLPAVMITQQADFMDELPACEAARVDIVLMNPPFERDAAPAHVLHALSWLKPGGRLVSVMPANWADKSSADRLMKTIDDRGFSMMDMEIEAGSFNTVEAFRQTGVRVSLLIINA